MMVQSVTHKVPQDTVSEQHAGFPAPHIAFS
jgi:hypothetical protein